MTPPGIPHLTEKKAFDPWLGSLTLKFEHRNHQTYLTRRKHRGPLLVQRPFYPEGSICHVYLIHPPGGVVGGDQLSIDVACEQSTQVLLTTPAAAKFYRSDAKTAHQIITLKVADNAILEWLPQETLLFNGADINSTTRVELQQNSRFFGWEMTGIGRPVCNESFETGCAIINLEFALEDKPLLTERMQLTADSLIALSGLSGHSLVANLFVYPANNHELEKVRKIAKKHRFFGATLINNFLVCRMLGTQAEPVRNLFTEIWQALRPDLNQRQACLPRIWAT